MERNFRIDRLRGLAVFVVVMSHSTGFMQWNFYPYFIEVESLRTNGIYGVSIFFTVSGFLIANKLLSVRQMRPFHFLQSFYIGRVGRLLPCLLLVVPLAYVMGIADINQFAFDHNFAEFVTCLATLTYNVCLERGAGLPIPWNIFWSLSIEEVFYVVAPIVVICLRRDVLILGFLLATIFGCICSKLWLHVGLYSYFSHFDGLAIGCVTAMIASRIPIKSNASLRWCGLLGFVLVLFAGRVQQNYKWSLIAISISSALYLAGCGPSERRTGRLFIPIELAGQFSYEIYLFHFTVLALVISPLNALIVQSPLWPYTGYLCTAGAGVVLLAIGIIVSTYYAEPFSRLIKKVFSREQIANPRQAMSSAE